MRVGIVFRMDYNFRKIGVGFNLVSSKDLFRSIIELLKSGRFVMLGWISKEYSCSSINGDVVFKCSYDYFVKSVSKEFKILRISNDYVKLKLF